ncbi:Outer membrane protein, OmpA/MotB family protein [Sulfitobacter noctilucae]|uniref:OmpA family protein n=1 Tax=Sulfitobacter noctilucae TaxID=1342302 RepID=UPI000AB4E61A|nr:OmpA family protein [Sulfitobacter noctilucae]KIN60806.1 Outer membrane protein, OmpA/MotB family protein [Sulfitobacter noctilucae]
MKSTTALGMSLALAIPMPVVAQDAETCALDGTQVVFPCVVDDQVINTSEEIAPLLEEALPEEASDQAATDDAAADQAAADQAAADQAAADQAAADQAAADQAAADQAAADQAAADQAAADQAAADQAAADQAAADQAAADQAAADEAAADQAAADQAAADQAAADQAAADQAAADQAAADQAEANQAAADQAAADKTAADETAAEQAATDSPATEKTAEDLAAAEAQAEIDREALRQQRAAERQAELDAAAAAAAEAPSEEVVTEDITEEDVRTSSEEFETAVTGDQAAATEQTDEDDGLSKFEKALLLGLGAVVVGSVLKNGDKIVSRSGDRVVVEDPNGDLRVLKDEDALIRRPGDQVSTETFNDGSSRNIVTKPDGSQIVTIQGRDGSVLRRINIDAQGNEYVLFDDLAQEEEVVVSELPQVRETAAAVGVQNEDALRAALEAQLRADNMQRFSLRQVRDIRQVRALAPELELDAVRFETGSAAIRPEQARSLANIGSTLARLVAEDPRTVILVEGHTDAVGNATYNLALSDRRAETVALALTEYFDVPAANMITQGYGESALKVLTETSEQANRRAVVRNITSLLR